jgi:hypothetical protein
MAMRKNVVSLDDLNPFDLDGTAEDIALVERGLAILARKQSVWSAILDKWKMAAGIQSAPAAMSAHNEREPAIRSMASLIQLYRMDERSPFQKIQFSTRGNYEAHLRRIERDIGDVELAQWKGEHIKSAYEAWTKGGTTNTMAHGLVTMLRGLFGFGALLGDRECERLSVIMHKMRFPMIRSRNVRLTAEHATKIIGRAHEKGLHSLALAQAIQFELGLGQKHVIGEWVPPNEPGESNVVSGGVKWLRGLRWGEIDNSRLLACPMVTDAIDRYMGARTGPMIVYEKTGLPYFPHQWRREWRAIANEVGVPKRIFNRDSRRRKSGMTSDNFDDAEPTSEARH